MKQMGKMFACAQHTKANAVVVGTHGSSRAGESGAVIKVDSVNLKVSVNPLSTLSTTSLDNQKPQNKLEWDKV